jgi:hypothetical protein
MWQRKSKLLHRTGRELRSDREKLQLPLLNYGTRLPRHPKIKKITHITRNKKNKTFAISVDAAAMPPNPKTAAISAIKKSYSPA